MKTIKTATIPVPADSLRWTLDRALNTLEPPDWPAWAREAVDGIKPTDSISLVVKRTFEEDGREPGEAPQDLA